MQVNGAAAVSLPHTSLNCHIMTPRRGGAFCFLSGFIHFIHLHTSFEREDLAVARVQSLRGLKLAFARLSCYSRSAHHFQRLKGAQAELKGKAKGKMRRLRHEEMKSILFPFYFTSTACVEGVPVWKARGRQAQLLKVT